MKVTERYRQRLASPGMLLVTFCVFAAGCGSFYRQARPELPPEPHAQVERRMEEARKAENTASQAGQTLREHLRQGATGETLETDLDRLEVAAYDLERRSLAARDAAKPDEQDQKMGREIDRFNARAKAWLEFVQTARHENPTAQSSRLDEVLSVHDQGRN